ncbi:apolipoprotein N-acyltransferase [Eionea flava]
MRNHTSHSTYFSLLLCLFAGAITPLSFAPFHLWPVSLLSLAILGALLSRAPTAKLSLLLALAFGLGYFGTGVSWVYVSIYYFGSTGWFLAILMTSLFIAFVAYVFALPFYLLRYCKPTLRLLIGFPVLWVLSEWLRTWVFTGFPWLFLGYSHTDTLLSGWAPIGGVLLISFFSVLSSSLLAMLALWARDQRHSNLPNKVRTKILYPTIGLVAALWIAGYPLSLISWTTALPNNVSVGLVQPNIPQHLRWSPDYQETIRERLRELSKPLWGKDWIIWSEAAIPAPYQYATDFINETKHRAQQSGSTVISGVLYEKPITTSNVHKGQQYFNSVIGIGDSDGIYHKQRLVPFGEYVPLESWLRGLIEFFDLPFSVITQGSNQQEPLRIGEHLLANAICYEIAYPALVAQQAASSHALLTISNDAWFGDSIGPLQHFQMARMRAIEIGRYVIRGTNNGVSAIINTKGKVTQKSDQFVMDHLEGYITPMTGNTPFMIWRNGLILSLLIALSAIAVLPLCRWRSMIGG